MNTSNILSLSTAVLAMLFHPSTAFQVPSPANLSNKIVALNGSRRQYLIGTISTAAVIQSQPILALTDSSTPLDFQGVYTDPRHPNSYLVIFGNNHAQLKLQDDPSDAVYTLPVDVQTKSDGTVQFTFDFSSKGGPSNVHATFTKDKEGIPLIKFPDDTLWKKRETGPIGVYSDTSTEEKVIVIRQIKGVQWAVEVISGGEVVSGTAQAGNPILFSIGDERLKGVFDMKQKRILLDDGRVWTKI
jgi:hypothetical protein